MKRKLQIISVAFILLVILGLIYFSIRNYLAGPYPPLAKQRAALLNKPRVPPTRLLDSSSILNDLKFLASDTCEGRAPGSKGHDLAAARIIQRMRMIGLDSFDNSLMQPFIGKFKNGSWKGENIIGWINGTNRPEEFIVISAHYDHLGIKNGMIYHGASDNASGTACLLALAQYFKQHPLPCSLIFAAFDREETGMEGSSFFVEHLSVPLKHSKILLDLNIDMIARNDHNEIFVCGVRHYPSFKSLINKLQDKTNAKVLMGHDSGKLHDDWTYWSDHYPFYKKKIPFLYFGVEDHIDYHQPTDVWEKFDLSSYIENCNMIAQFTMMLKTP